MIRKGIWAKGPFSPGTSGPFPLHPLTCSWPINEVTFGMNRGVSPPLHRRPWHISLYIKHFHKLMGWCIHTQTHTHLFSRTPPHAEAYWHNSSALLSLSLSLSVPAGWVQHISLLRLAHSCLPSRRKRHENAMFSPTYIPVTHFLKNSSLSWSLLWGNDRNNLLVPSVSVCVYQWMCPRRITPLDSQVCMCVCVCVCMWPTVWLYKMLFTVVQSSPGTCSHSVHRKNVKNLVHWTIRLQNQLQDSITSSCVYFGPWTLCAALPPCGRPESVSRPVIM